MGGSLELTNPEDDIGDSKNLAAAHGELVARMEEIMEHEHVPSKLFAMPPIDER